jgi:two-component system, NtrC family, response regulator
MERMMLENGNIYTVLIVDDEAEILRTLKSFLGLCGFNVLTASSGIEAIEAINSQKVHIVLSDISMPGMDGIELLKQIRSLDFSIQVIMMTGFSTFNTTLVALENGATDYILKPFEDMDEIERIVGISVERLQRWRRVLTGSSRGKHRK